MTQDVSDLIKRLRLLRANERRLRDTLVADLRAFQKPDDRSFFTLPISDKQGISVASTCTALMALIDSNKLKELLPSEQPAQNEPNDSPDSSKSTSAAVRALDQRRHKKTTGLRRDTRLAADARKSSERGGGHSTEVKPVANSKEVPAGDASTPKQTDLLRAAQTGDLVSPKELFVGVMQEKWSSSGLNDLNAFTTCIVIRAAGFLVSSELLTAEEARNLTHRHHESPRRSNKAEIALRKLKEPSLSDVIRITAENAEDSFRVEDYPPKTTMAYWFVDGITKAGIDIKKEYWARIAEWAAKQFERQLSYVDSGNDPLMDPASLAMAACLVSRIRKTCAGSSQLSGISKTLPSRVELIHAVEQVFKKQTDSGIWHKYFPLFHFPGSGAADYCFSFEFLEAILVEFSDMDILENALVLDGIEKAVTWCRDNRFQYREGDDTYSGWNAGGEVENLAAGMPEAWATASIHIFLAELDSAISHSLQKLILTRLRGEIPTETKLEHLVEVRLQLQGEKKTTLKAIVEEKLLPKKAAESEKQENLEKPEQLENPGKLEKLALGLLPSGLRWRPLVGSRSALLFGPPGTSKTTFAEALAERLGWPFVVITPSDFLSKGLEQIYVRANEIFEDLMDIAGTVVLFDEMDALVQTREIPQQKAKNDGGHKQASPGLDVARQLLTTSMLPKLADLHKQARVIFLMATNHKQQLDPAITRPGRFDLLLCVGPPSWKYMLEGLALITKKDIPSKDLASVQARLREFAKPSATTKRLDRFTVADLKSFLQYLKDVKKTKVLQTALENMTAAEFREQVKEWAEKYIIMNDESGLLQEFKDDFKASRVQ